MDRCGQDANISVPVSYFIILKFQRYHGCNWISIKFLIQADLGGTAGSALDHRNKASLTIKQVMIFMLIVGEGGLQFVNNATSMKHNKTRYACGHHHYQLNVIYNKYCY